MPCDNLRIAALERVVDERAGREWKMVWRHGHARFRPRLTEMEPPHAIQCVENEHRRSVVIRPQHVRNSHISMNLVATMLLAIRSPCARSRFLTQLSASPVAARSGSTDTRANTVATGHARCIVPPDLARSHATMWRLTLVCTCSVANCGAIEREHRTGGGPSLCRRRITNREALALECRA